MKEKRTLGKAQLGAPKLSGEIGERLHAVRKQLGLSQRELARRADITNSSLSMIEQGKVSPSVASLEKILAVIPMSLQEFFSDALELASPILARDDFVCTDNEGIYSEVMSLAQAGREGVFLARKTFKAGAKINAEWMTHKGFIGGIVIRGSLVLKLDGAEYELKAGEGFHFSLHRSHSYRNLGHEECEIISVSFSDRRG
ncbi:helix-turn-helix domain-containing protein [Teredinibacter waterburyi]|uniref:helix-turn-helix domain-containing protein n=1 Tax=Teredinibacter waterburyi TaxID=1500538 RepID=UPI00165F0B1C|nr:helix-turn-helix domain-containing protein [Teredinibacter waterburyi]